MKSFQQVVFLVLVTFMSIPLHFHMAGLNEQPAKDRLLIFTGSDWCPNCRRLEKKILNDSVFVSFIRDRITIEFADFPQHKKLEKSVVDRNRILAEKYHFKGIYPTILLLDSAGNLLGEIFYRNQDSAEFIYQLKLILKH